MEAEKIDSKWNFDVFIFEIDLFVDVLSISVKSFSNWW